MLEKFKSIALLNAVSAAIAIVNNKGILVESNNAFTQLIPKVAKGESILMLINNNSVKKSLLNKHKSFTAHYCTAQLILFDLEFNMLDSEDEIFYVVTAQKTQVLDNYSYLQQLINNIPDNIFIKDSEGNFILANNWVARTMGVDSPEELIGKKDVDYMASDLANKYAKDEQEIVRTGKPLLNNQEIIIVDGETRWYSTTKIPLYNNDVIVGVMGIGRDITHFVDEKKQIEKAWKEASKADHLKSAFLANLSHEIRTPLNGILGFSQFLKQKQTTIEKQHKYLDIIHNNGKQLLMLLNDIIDVSMIESNQISINKQTFRINGLILQLHSNFEHHIATNSLPIELTFKPGLKDKEDYLYSDDYRIHQVLSNLIGNAIKFTKSGVIKIGYTKEGDFIQFYVSDTGIGISADLQSLIFKRFRQADDSITRKYGGTGLGLSICKGLVEKLGGNVWVDSKTNKGSTFYFTIPFDKKPTS